MMFTLFHENSDTKIVLPQSAGKPILAAVRDLQRDLLRLSGHETGFETAAAADKAICISLDGSMEPEAFAVSVTEAGVQLTGADELGAVYGIYAFEETFLGISPMHRISGLFPACIGCLSLEDGELRSRPSPVRYRGWFLNDEDLLTDFLPGGGNRHIDYPYYAHVMHPDVLELVLETALRLRLNLMIPSSFVDIDNPDEERLVRQVTERGMYITQHHVEPMGVSWFGAENYMKKHGISGEVSFLSNRAVMEEIWRYYAKKWAVYGKQVIWQLGLRGKGDRTVWASDPNVPSSAQTRGGIITDAIRLQYDIVAETLGSDDFASTATLWLEGAELYGIGALQIPEKTIVIFSDIGYNQMFGDDFYTVPHKPGCRYGVYYHIAYFGNGPHLAEGCSPEKMLFSYQEAYRTDNLTYSILNVSNLRELHLSAHLNAAILQDPADFDLQAFTQKQFTALYGDAADDMIAVRKQYFDAYAELPEADLIAKCHRDNYNFYYHDYGRLPFKNFAAVDGIVRFFCTNPSFAGEALPDGWYALLAESAERFHAVAERCAALRDRIPAESREFFEIYQLLQAVYMENLIRWSLACQDAVQHRADRALAQADTERAVGYIETILRARRICEQGAWQGWYNGDSKIGVKLLPEKTRQALGALIK